VVIVCAVGTDAALIGALTGIAEVGTDSEAVQKSCRFQRWGLPRVDLDGIVKLENR